MAQTTIELRRLLATNFKLFDFTYQFDDPDFKKEIEEHIINHFYSYEIGFETPDMFKQKFKAKWLRMIGYYNQLYNTTLLSYNPLTNISMNEALDQLGKTTSNQDTTSTAKNTGKGTSTGNTTTKGTADNQTTTEGNSTTNEKASDYPQQSISGGDYLSGERVTNGDSGSEVNSLSATTGENKTEQSSTEESSGNSSSNAKANTDSESSYKKKIEGISGTSYQELIKQERTNLLRIPDMIVNEMKSCFMMVY